jgi:hypothetical protein
MARVDWSKVMAGNYIRPHDGGYDNNAGAIEWMESEQRRFVSNQGGDIGSSVIGTINPPVNITIKMVDDILVAAFEGGINYWCREVIVADFKNQTLASNVIAAGGEIFLVPNEEDERSYRLTLDSFLKGYQAYCVLFEQSPSTVYENHDASTADCIVQLAIFGEILYG